MAPCGLKQAQLTMAGPLNSTPRRWLRSGGLVLTFRRGRSQEGPVFVVTQGQDASGHQSQLSPTSGNIILSLASLEARDL